MKIKESNRIAWDFMRIMLWDEAQLPPDCLSRWHEDWDYSAPVSLDHPNWRHRVSTDAIEDRFKLITWTTPLTRLQLVTALKRVARVQVKQKIVARRDERGRKLVARPRSMMYFDDYEIHRIRNFGPIDPEITS